jgi:hypothetical protein
MMVLACGGAWASDRSPERPAQPAESAAPAATPSDDTRLDGLQKPEVTEPKAEQSWWQRVLRDSPLCKSFTDGCRTCSDSYVCSNIGIACQPKDWSCSDPSNAKPHAKPDAKPDEKPDDKPKQ